MRARITTNPPKPAIKLVLPLTSSLDIDFANPQTRDAASLLIVLQGPWYAIGGLAETFAIQIVATRDKRLSEAGLDPDESGQGATAPYTLNPFHGPVGHTFDESDISPRWVNCSFVLPPPTPPGNLDARNNFAEVQFKRKLVRQGLAAGTKDLESEWTEPYWVQFLPSRLFSDLMDGTTKVNLSTARLRIGSNQSLSFTDASNKQLTVASDGTAHRKHFVLLTERVQDLLGRLGQERFVAVCEPDPDNANGWTCAPAAAVLKFPPTPAPPRYVARIVEVQLPSNQNAKSVTWDHLWGQLFPRPDPGNDLLDAQARIVSISPPIDQSKP